MSKKIRVGILFGGKSAEHEVSLQSAKNVVEAIDKEKYEVVLIGIDKQGRWYLNDESHFLLNAENPKLISLNKSNKNIALVTGKSGEREIVSVTDHASFGAIDVVFPILHGTFGEDGTVQGLLKLANVPFVGAGVLGSSVAMDKDVMKRLLRDAGIPIGKFLTFDRVSIETANFKEIEKQLGLPLFVKPANLGSSVGIHKAHSQTELEEAVKDAFHYDTKILIEEFIDGREIECSVLGNEDPIASTPGEIIPQHEFYSYEAKYIDEQGALLEIPAKLPRDLVKQIQQLAIKAFQALCCEGMARVDIFLTKDNKVLLNEINTIPGFTKISMYPKLWEVSGIPYSELIDKLIQLAIERFEREQKLKTNFEL
ncbi:D-alanine--D-alanine ligase [candidate division KSB1 bacterium]|nr:D-alanine--D-alanine ligase [candidate division KSB1 bacterium]